MLSFKDGRPIAVIRKGKYDGKIVYITDDTENKKNTIKKSFDDVQPYIYDKIKELNEKQYTVLRLSVNSETEPRSNDLKPLYREAIELLKNDKNRDILLKNGFVQPIPNPDTRDVMYVAGPSGSGKSTFVAKYAAEYRKIFPNNNIYIFSRLPDDESLDKMLKTTKKSEIIRIDCTNPDIFETPIDPSELENSLCIFDDTDTLPNKKIKDAVNRLKDDLLETGRHNNVYLCITSHQLTNYKESRNVLNEMHSIVVFPKSGSSYAIEYVLKKHFGLCGQDIKKIIALPSRWVQIKKNYPQCVLYENGIFLI